MSLHDGLVDTRPLRSSPAFRRLWVGSSLSVMGGQMAVVAVLYQAWELTGSPVAVGTVGLAQAVPMVVFSQIGGSLADAVDRRRLVALTTTGQILAAGLLAGQALAGLGSLWLLLALAAMQVACGTSVTVTLMPLDAAYSSEI
jgi:MFS family permease